TGSSDRVMPSISMVDSGCPVMTSPLICKVDGVCKFSWDISPESKPKNTGEEPKDTSGSSDTSMPSASAEAWNWSFTCFAVNQRIPNSANKTTMSRTTSTLTMVFQAVEPADLVFAIATSVTYVHYFGQREALGRVITHS